MKSVERKCRNCDHFFESYFCGYNSSNCKVHGSLDMDQHERHPDTEAARCKDFTPKREHPPREPFAGVIDRIMKNGRRAEGRRRRE